MELIGYPELVAVLWLIGGRQMEEVLSLGREIRKNFESLCSRRLKDKFLDARKKDAKPSWLSDEVWDGLKRYWRSEEFKSKSDKGKQNRASDVGGLGTSLHTGGSIPMTEHKRRLEKQSREGSGSYESLQGNPLEKERLKLGR